MGQTQTPLSVSTQQLRKVTNVTATAAGTAAFIFEAPPDGYTWTGTLSCTTAPASASFTAMIGGISWSQWNGQSVGGPIQLFIGDVLTVNATGLVPGAEYLLWLIGSHDESGAPAPVWPDPTSSLATVAAGSASQLGTSGTFPTGSTVTVPSAIRTVIIRVAATGGTVTSISVTGAQTGLVYYNAAPYLASGGIGLYFAVVPVLPTPDTAVVVSGTLSAGTAVLTVYGDVTEYPESTFYNGVPQYASTTAVATTTLTTGPCRLLTATVDTSAASAAARITVGGTTLIRADMGATAGGVAESMTLPQPFIVASGVAVQAIILTGGFAGIAFAYP